MDTRDVISSCKRVSNLLKSANKTEGQLKQLVKNPVFWDEILIAPLHQAMITSMFDNTQQYQKPSLLKASQKQQSRKRFKKQANITPSQQETIRCLKRQALVVKIKEDGSGIVTDLTILSPSENFFIIDGNNNLMSRKPGLKVVVRFMYSLIFETLFRFMGKCDDQPINISEQKMPTGASFRDIVAAKRIKTLRIWTLDTIVSKNYWETGYMVGCMAIKEQANLSEEDINNRKNELKRQQYQLYDHKSYILTTNPIISKFKLSDKHWQWFEKKYSDKANHKGTVYFRCPIHQGGDEKKNSMILSRTKFLYDEYESFGDMDSEIYVKCIRKRMKYLRDHIKMSLKELVVNEDNDYDYEEDFSGISDKDLIAVFEKEAKNCGCCKWPEELVKDETTEGYGNVYKSSMFSLYRISYGYQYTCYPCQASNIAISDELAELIVQNNNGGR